jgi:hypothetical protein
VRRFGVQVTGMPTLTAFSISGPSARVTLALPTKPRRC